MERYNQTLNVSTQLVKNSPSSMNYAANKARFFAL